MHTRVYIAGASSEVTRARAARTQLEAGGLTVTSTWPDVIEQVGQNNPRDASISDLARWALTDLAELHAADALWLLLPFGQTTTVGAWIELGVAFEARKAIIMSGPHRPIFTPVLADHHFELDHDAGRLLVEKHEETNRRAINGFLMDSTVRPW